MRDRQLFTLSDGTLLEVDFANAYREVTETIAGNRGAMSATRSVKLIYRLLRITPDMLMEDACKIRETWTKYLAARQIEEALKNG